MVWQIGQTNYKWTKTKITFPKKLSKIGQMANWGLQLRRRSGKSWNLPIFDSFPAKIEFSKYLRLFFLLRFSKYFTFFRRWNWRMKLLKFPIFFFKTLKYLDPRYRIPVKFIWNFRYHSKFSKSCSKIIFSNFPKKNEKYKILVNFATFKRKYPLFLIFFISDFQVYIYIFFGKKLKK